MTTYLTPETTLYRLVKDHTEDEHCIVDPKTNLCIGCGAEHGEPCAACGKRAYHADGCPIFIAGITCEGHLEWSTLHKLPASTVTRNSVLLLYFAVMLGIAAWLTEIGLHLHN